MVNVASGPDIDNQLKGAPVIKIVPHGIHIFIKGTSRHWSGQRVIITIDIISHSRRLIRTCKHNETHVINSTGKFDCSHLVLGSFEEFQSFGESQNNCAWSKRSDCIDSSVPVDTGGRIDCAVVRKGSKGPVKIRKTHLRPVIRFRCCTGIRISYL